MEEKDKSSEKTLGAQLFTNLALHSCYQLCNYAPVIESIDNKAYRVDGTMMSLTAQPETNFRRAAASSMR